MERCPGAGAGRGSRGFTRGLSRAVGDRAGGTWAPVSSFFSPLTPDNCGIKGDGRPPQIDQHTHKKKCYETKLLLENVR